MKWSRARRSASFFDLTLATATLALLTVVFWWHPHAFLTSASALDIISTGSLLLSAGLLMRLAAVTHHRTRLKRLLRRSLQQRAAAQKAERHRIARELHDGISQMLVCARHALELPAGRAVTRAELTELLAQGQGQLDAAIREIRRVSHGYKSILLHDRDFTEALQLLGLEFAGRTRIHLDLERVDSSVNRMLNTSAKGALLRIAQEALTNVQRHSGASCVQLAVRPHCDHVELRVMDNGRRRRPHMNDCLGRPGIGISNMRERAAELGGTLSVEFADSHTEVVARVPPLSTH